MTEKFTSLEEALREKLDGYNDVVSDSVFAKLQQKRAYQQRLNDVSSELPSAAIFENIQFKRELQNKINHSTTDVPSGALENVAYQKVLQSKIDSLEPPVRSVLFERMQGKRVLQAKLTDFESPVSANLFDKIQNARKVRKPKFTVYYWAVASVAACLLLWLLSSQLQITQNKDADKNSSVSNLPSTNQNGIFNPKEKGEQNKDLKTTLENKEKSSNFEQKNSLTNTQNYKNENETPERQIVLGSHGAISRIERQKNKVSENKIIRSNDGFSAQTLSTQEQKIILDAASSPKKIIIDSAENIANVVDFSKPTEVVAPSDALNNMQVKGAAKNLDLANASELNTQLYKKGIKSLKSINPCGGPGDQCPTFGGPRIRNSVRSGVIFEPFIGVAAINRSLTSTLGDYTAYGLKRDSAEKAQYAVQGGVMLGYQFGNGVHISSGIRYERISEKATYDSLGVGQIEFIVSKNPTTGLNDTSAKVITDGIFRKTRFNTISSFEIPIRLGYTMVLNRDWALDFAASAGFNISTLTKQSIYNPEGVLIDNTNVSNNYFKKSYGWSTGLSVGVSRALSANTQLVVSAYGNYKTMPVTTTDYVLTQKYSTFGINAAWRYQF